MSKAVQVSPAAGALRTILLAASAAGLLAAAACSSSTDQPSAAVKAADYVPGKAFETGVVEAGGYTLRYSVAGPSGAPVIVSLPGSAGLEMSRAKDQLVDQFRIIEINPPGWGDDPELSAEMTQEEIGRILGEAANKLVEGRYHLIGTSMGGGNALWLAAHYPDRVKSILLEGGMAPTRESDLTSPLITTAFVRQQRAAPSQPNGGYPTPPMDPAKPWATGEYNMKQMQNRFKMMSWVQCDIGDDALFAKIRASGIPVYGLLGDKDGIIKPTVQEYYAQVLPESKFMLVPGGGHDLQNTQTDVFVREARQFFRTAGP
ncbi:MAG: alpha/beta hydrolase [Steroidobacteraceae bacterium]